MPHDVALIATTRNRAPFLAGMVLQVLVLHFTPRTHHTVRRQGRLGLFHLIGPGRSVGRRQADASKPFNRLA